MIPVFSSRIPTRLSLVQISVLTFSLMTAQVVSAQGDDGKTIDPEAIAIVQAAIDFIAEQPAVAVDWFVSYDVVVDGREKLTNARSGRNELIRGVGFFGYAEHGLETREYYYDFNRFTVFDVEANAYATTPYRGVFRSLTERLAEEYDLRLPIWTLMSADPGRELLESVDAAAYLGVTRVAGQWVHHLALSDYEQDWQMWISDNPDAPEIVMLVGTNPYEQGWPQYRAYFSNWEFDLKADAGRFVFEPTDDAVPMVWPKRVVNQEGAGQ